MKELYEIFVVAIYENAFKVRKFILNAIFGVANCVYYTAEVYVSASRLESVASCASTSAWMSILEAGDVASLFLVEPPPL